jgi:two-component system, OmpR family, response regulator MtrA
VVALAKSPIVICISPDATERLRLAELLAGQGVVLLCPDVASAREMLNNTVEPLARQPLRLVGEAPPPAAAETGTRPVGTGGLVLDHWRHRALWQGRPLHLTHLQLEVLMALAALPGAVLSHARLYETAWQQDYLGDASIVHSTVKRVRRILSDAGTDVSIESVRGVGFRLICPVSHATRLAPTG